MRERTLYIFQELAPYVSEKPRRIGLKTAMLKSRGEGETSLSQCFVGKKQLTAVLFGDETWAASRGFVSENNLSSPEAYEDGSMSAS